MIIWQKLVRLFQTPFRLRQCVREIVESQTRNQDHIKRLEAAVADQFDQIKRFEAAHAHLEAQTQAQYEWLTHQNKDLAENSSQFQERMEAALWEKVSSQHLAKDLDRVTRNLLAVLHDELVKRDDYCSREQEAGNKRVDCSSQLEDVRLVDFYQTLENCFRGNPEDIKGRLRIYLEYLPELKNASMLPVLDIGCGRGEWLDLLGEHGIAARGIDLNPINGDECRSRGLDVTTGDALAHIMELPDNSCSAVTAFHLVEHLPFSALLTLADQIMRILEPGGVLIFELPNPENLLVATHNFWIDPTHIRLLPPPLMEFLVAQRGFLAPQILRLHPVESTCPSGDVFLHSMVYGPRDYAVIAHKPSGKSRGTR